MEENSLECLYSNIDESTDEDIRRVRAFPISVRNTHKRMTGDIDRTRLYEISLIT